MNLLGIISFAGTGICACVLLSVAINWLRAKFRPKKQTPVSAKSSPFAWPELPAVALCHECGEQLNIIKSVLTGAGFRVPFVPFAAFWCGNAICKRFGLLCVGWKD